MAIYISKSKGWVYINSLVTNMFLCGIFEHLLQEKGLLEIDLLLFVETNAEDRIRRVVSCLKTNALSDLCCSFPSHRSQIPMSIIFPSSSLLVCIKTNLMLIIRMFLLSGGFLLPACTLCCLILRP